MTFGDWISSRRDVWGGLSLVFAMSGTVIGKAIGKFSTARLAKSHFFLALQSLANVLLA